MEENISYTAIVTAKIKVRNNPGQRFNISADATLNASGGVAVIDGGEVTDPETSALLARFNAWTPDSMNFDFTAMDDSPEIVAEVRRFAAEIRQKAAGEPLPVQFAPATAQEPATDEQNEEQEGGEA